MVVKPTFQRFLLFKMPLQVYSLRDAICGLVGQCHLGFFFIYIFFIFFYKYIFFLNFYRFFQLLGNYLTIFVCIAWPILGHYFLKYYLATSLQLLSHFRGTTSALNRHFLPSSAPKVANQYLGTFGYFCLSPENPYSLVFVFTARVIHF